MPPYFWLGVFKGLEKLSILILEYYLRFFNSGRLAVVVPLTVVYSFGKLRESLVSGSVNVDNSQKIQASELSGIHLGDAFLRFYAESFDKPPVLLL